MEDSPIIKELKELNKNTFFNEEIQDVYYYNFNCVNELEFNRFRRESYLIKIINKEMFKWRLLIQIAEENNRIYNLYLKEIGKLKSKYREVLTDELFEKFKSIVKSKPIVEPKIIINATYKSPKTGKILSKTQEIDYFKIKEQMPYALWSDEKVPTLNNNEENLKNFIITKNYINNGIKIIDQLTPFEFEVWIANFMNKCGYKAFATSKSGDFGADVLAEKSNTRIGIQCKMSKNMLGVRCVQEIIAGVNYYHADEGWVISTAPGFTLQANKLAKCTNIKLFTKEQTESLLNSLLNLYNIG